MLPNCKVIHIYNITEKKPSHVIFPSTDSNDETTEMRREK